MKVSNSRPVGGVYGVYKKSGPGSFVSEKIGDIDLSISQRAVDFSSAMEKLKGVEPVRREKVENIKKQIQNGSYVIDSAKIARAMLFGEIND